MANEQYEKYKEAIKRNALKYYHENKEHYKEVWTLNRYRKLTTEALKERKEKYEFILNMINKVLEERGEEK